MLEIAKLIVTEYMAVYSIDCIDKRGCTSQQLYAKKKGRYSIHCITHSSPEARGLAVNVNVSRRQFDNADLHEQVRQALDVSGLSADALSR